MSYEIRLAKQSGGKAGKGRNKTSTIQVVRISRYSGTVVKQFRFNVGELSSFIAAKTKAEEYVKNIGEST